MAKIVRFEAETIDGLEMVASKSRKQNDDETTNFILIFDGEGDSENWRFELGQTDAVELAEMILEVYGKPMNKQSAIFQNKPPGTRTASTDVDSARKRAILEDIEANRMKSIRQIMNNLECSEEDAETIYNQESEARLAAETVGAKPVINGSGMSIEPPL